MDRYRSSEPEREREREKRERERRERGKETGAALKACSYSVRNQIQKL